MPREARARITLDGKTVEAYGTYFPDDKKFLPNGLDRCLKEGEFTLIV